MPSKTAFTRKLERAIAERWQGSKSAFARELGITPSVLQKYLSGSTPKPDRLHRMSVVLGVDLDWLLREDEHYEPVSAAGEPVHAATAAELVAELHRRYHALVTSINTLMDRAETLPWESIAVWLLREPKPTNHPPLVELAIRTFKDLNDQKRELGYIAESAAPRDANIRLAEVLQAEPEMNPAAAIEHRMESLREERPGVFGIAHWICTFDHEWMDSQSLGGIPDSPEEWDDRRAWLLAKLVTHESLADDPQYDEIRQRLRKLKYIDEHGKPKGFGAMSEPLGSFELPEPE